MGNFVKYIALSRSGIVNGLKLLARLTLISFVSLNLQSAAVMQSDANAKVSTQELRSETNEFLTREIAAHFADMKTLSPQPDRVVGGLTVGEFSWGSFARALAAQADLGGNRWAF